MAGDLDRHSDSYGCLALFAGVLVLGLVILAVVWFVSTVGHVLELTPTYPEIDKHGHAWTDARYENVTWGYVLTVLTLLGGVPLSIALTAELGDRGRGPAARSSSRLRSSCSSPRSRSRRWVRADAIAPPQDGRRRPARHRQRRRPHLRAARGRARRSRGGRGRSRRAHRANARVPGRHRAAGRAHGGGRLELGTPLVATALAMARPRRRSPTMHRPPRRDRPRAAPPRPARPARPLRRLRRARRPQRLRRARAPPAGAAPRPSGAHECRGGALLRRRRGRGGRRLAHAARGARGRRGAARTRPARRGARRGRTRSPPCAPRRRGRPPAHDRGDPRVRARPTRGGAPPGGRARPRARSAARGRGARPGAAPELTVALT